MELKAKDTYRVECTDTLSEDVLTSLSILYQPLIGKDALALYLVLHAEGRRQRLQQNHNRLSAILNMSIDDIERARIHLEEYMLMRTYVQSSDQKSSYIYELLTPLPVHSFLSSQQFMTMYAKAVGQKNAEVTVSKLESDELSTSGYQNITRKVSHVVQDRDYEPGVVYHKIEPRYNFEDDNLNINFDYEHFIATTSTLVFPAELRTQENLKLIGKLATIYGLSADRMRILVSRCVNISSMTFDADKLKTLAAMNKPDITEAKDPYSLPPVSFLQAKQNGAAVSMMDKKMLEHLSVDMHFSNEVINVMIEYILKKSQNRLVKAFVDMVAGEWARDGVKTKQDAIAETKKQDKPNSAGKKKAVVPQWYLEQGKNEKPVEAAHQENHYNAEEMLRKMKEKNGSEH